MTVASDRPDCVTCGARLTGAADVAYCDVCIVETVATRWLTGTERYVDVVADTGVDETKLLVVLKRRADRMLAVCNRICGLPETDTSP